MNVRKHLFSASLVYVLSSSTAIAADRVLRFSSDETVTPLVELYTSEGCSSCPPADEFLTSLGSTIDSNFRAVPLAFHVDYWNWLGWEDPFSKSQYTERQRFLAGANQQRSIYTPELLVAGKESRGGLDVVERIKYANAMDSLVDIMLSLESDNPDRITVNVDIDNMAAGIQAEAYIAIYENRIVRKIQGGENSGRTLVHDYVVRFWSDPVQVPEGKLSNERNFKLDKSWETRNLGVVIAVVNSRTGETLQAISAPIHPLFSG